MNGAKKGDDFAQRLCKVQHTMDVRTLWLGDQAVTGQLLEKTKQSNRSDVNLNGMRAQATYVLN